MPCMLPCMPWPKQAKRTASQMLQETSEDRRPVPSLAEVCCIARRKRWHTLCSSWYASWRCQIRHVLCLGMFGNTSKVPKCSPGSFPHGLNGRMCFGPCFFGPPFRKGLYIYIYILASNVHAHRCYRCYPKCPSFSTDHLKHGQTAYQNTSHVRPGFPGIQLTWPSTVARTSGCSASDVPWDGLGSLPCRPNKLNYKTIL